MSGARNSSQTDEFFTRGRNEALDVYYISQSYFGLPTRSSRNNGHRLILFKQTSGDVESMYKDIAGYDMADCEIKEMCRKACSERFNYLRIDMTKNKNEGEYRFFNESKNTYIECVPDTEDFLGNLKCCIQLKTDDLEKVNELLSLQNRVKDLRLKDKIGKQNFHEDMKKVFESVTKANRNVSEDETKTIKVTSEENNNTLANLNKKNLHILSDRGILASYSLSPLSKISNPEQTS